MKRNSSPGGKARIASLLAGVFVAASASAQTSNWTPQGGYVQLGHSTYSTQTAAIGLTWPWAWQRQLLGGQVGGYWDVYANYLRGEAKSPDTGSVHFFQVAAVPMFRYRFDGGQSPWFAEAGIGLSTMNRLYITERKQFSTRFQFSDNIAVGRNFGDGGRQEISLRLQHISNGGIKHPNPGDNFVQVRYAVKF